MALGNCCMAGDVGRWTSRLVGSSDTFPAFVHGTIGRVRRGLRKCTRRDPEGDWRKSTCLGQLQGQYRIRPSLLHLLHLLHSLPPFFCWQFCLQTLCRMPCWSTSPPWQMIQISLGWKSTREKERTLGKQRGSHEFSWRVAFHHFHHLDSFGTNSWITNPRSKYQSISESVRICWNLSESVGPAESVRIIWDLWSISEVSLHSDGIPGGALKKADFVSIRDELFAVTPLESLDAMDSLMPDGLDLDESVYWSPCHGGAMVPWCHGLYSRGWAKLSIFT